MKALLGIGGPDDPYERYTRWAHIAAYVLIAGLVAELANGFIWFRGGETLAGIAATLLIVCGVWGEVYFGNKARIAGDKQLAEYRARANEAELLIERLRARLAPRMTLLKHAELIIALSDFSPLRGTIVVAPALPESEMFARQLHGLLGQAGWQISLLPSRPTTEQYFPTGVIVRFAIPPNGRVNISDCPPSATALVTKLNEFGIAANPIPDWENTTPDTIAIQISTP